MTIDTAALRAKARQEAEHFLKYDSEYRMGYITAETSNPITRRMSQTYDESTADGVRLLFSVDNDMSKRASETLKGEQFKAFATLISDTILGGGKVIFSGCGSTGRICMRLESSWRKAIKSIAEIDPTVRDAVLKYTESVGYIQTGGDYAVIRAVESFEDSAELGKQQAIEWEMSDKDLLVGITATAETTSILGSAVGALEQGARVFMLVCTDPIPLMDKMERIKQVYSHKNCGYLVLPCGPFALTGSSRMQSSTFEQLCSAVALENTLYGILEACGLKKTAPELGTYGQNFKTLTEQLMSDRAVEKIATATETEQAVYEGGGLMTLFAEECLLDVLTDTTERAPTFMTPPFCSLDMVGQPESWAFVKNPSLSTKEAWTDCFGRAPSCMEWSKEKYLKVGFTEEQVAKIIDISRHALERFPIGRESLPKREGKGSHALWVGLKSAPESFKTASENYSAHNELTLEGLGVSVAPTFMEIFEHLAVKLSLNVLSTGVMARMGKIKGNYMICLAMSNKKLVDRSARIVADVCGIPYEAALEENYYSALLCEATGELGSPAEKSILRLSEKE